MDTSTSAYSHITMAELWQRYAALYHRLRLLAPYGKLFDEAILQIQNHIELTTEAVILDAAGGDGGLLWALERHRPSVHPHVILLDSSQEMIKLARQEPYRGRVDIRLANIDQDASSWGLMGLVDVVHCGHAVYASLDPSALLQRFASVTKPHGVLVFTNPLPEPSMEALLQEHLRLIQITTEAAPSVVSKLLDELSPLVAINQEILRRQPQLHMADQDTVRSWIDLDLWEILDAIPVYAGNDIMVVARRKG